MSLQVGDTIRFERSFTKADVDREFCGSDYVILLCAHVGVWCGDGLGGDSIRDS